MSEAIIHGIILAFGLIIPLGVQNVFVFNQGASQPNIWRAAPVVLTASLCDTLLILIAVQGVSLVLLTFSWLTTTLYTIGFIFLIYMGFVIWRSKPSKDVKQEKSMPLKKQIIFAVSVSLLNPHAILDTIGVIGTNSIQYIGSEKWAFTSATIIISWIWFISLALAGKFLKRLDSTGKAIVLLNKISGLVIWGVALYMLKQVIFPN
ncbi:MULTISPECIES: LysE/ArgO family amino acid transporter [Bacillus]|jgi:L-lysine exporter family protein LysE/ArgO|uniref:Lysine transporter LysE n=1 Tax=Bacillus toyonensis TaxID=155322 RepID=A0A1V6LCX0_9BACI|nr:MULTISPECIES: LysE/ArgO family amino acid transporter [Bacillus]EEL35023.1 LysE/yggA [Bacillus cereus Rock3-28]EEL40643.1 LysE/yggA [Bacillus cereus Rock3-29]KAB0448839.1 lysine transporter LysE [Lysinibacillus sp. VIA-II-2016]KXY46323.1 lysine transporter LysE [Bacillus cereus]OFD03754.1 putative amino-acid transporter YisU [Bacillus thuringiensis]OTX34885.1 lysine transporter LysE [Bacillus thuringiensis serovar malayensis]OUB04853.1 lysine transporter LysE [Bacillus thuringiensis serov